MTNREMVSLPLRLEVLRPEGPGPFPATHAFDDDAASDPRTRYRADLAARTATLLVETAVRTIPKDRCPSTPPPAGPRAPG